MFFEGSEKKLEVITEGVDLRSWSDDRIDQLVHSAGAIVLNKIKNDNVDAYLLSESSLFVWPDRLIMITCGKTRLVSAITNLLKDIPEDKLRFMIYERKNEYFPQMQLTDFRSDVKILDEHLDGRAFRFGDADEHHLYLYHLKKPYTPDNGECTLELLMYDLQGKAREAFCKGYQTKKKIHDLTGVHELFDGFQIDDHVFEPYGYSMNAIRGNDYYTIHVTPQDSGPYVSFETNMSLAEGENKILLRVLEVFSPKTFDVVSFRDSAQTQDLEISGFKRRSYFIEDLDCGFQVKYAHFFQPYSDPQRAFELKR